MTTSQQSPSAWPGPADGMWLGRAEPRAHGDGTLVSVSVSLWNVNTGNDTHNPARPVYANFRLFKPCKTHLFKVITSTFLTEEAIF